jgi:hypothetical protein
MRIWYTILAGLNILCLKLIFNTTCQRMVLKIEGATGYMLDGQGSIPVRTKDFSLLHNIQTSSGAHPASCTMGTGESFPRVKVPGA